MSKIKTVLLVIVCILILFIVFQIVTADKYHAVVNVKEQPKTMGLNPTNENLDFGDLSREMKAARYIILKNNGANKALIKIFVFGEIADLIEIEKSSLILEPESEIRVRFDLSVPPSVEIKKYTGTVYVFKFLSF